MSEPIKGYRKLSDEEMAAINILKTLERELNGILDDLKTKDVDGRCLAIAKTHIETGFMFAVKSIARPE